MKTEDLERDIKYKKDAIECRENAIKSSEELAAQAVKDIKTHRHYLATLQGQLADLEAELAEKQPKLQDWDFGYRNCGIWIRIAGEVYYFDLADSSLPIRKVGAPFTDEDFLSSYKGNLKRLLVEIKDGGCIVGLKDKEIRRIAGEMTNDDNEILELSCDKCKKKKAGTYEELFGDLPSLRLSPKMMCKCGGKICIGFTGKYAERVE